jgi:hypothetical protein
MFQALLICLARIVPIGFVKKSIKISPLTMLMGVGKTCRMKKLSKFDILNHKIKNLGNSMKISGPSSTDKTSAPKKASRTGSSSGASSFGGLLATGETEAPAHTAASNVIAGIDSLLAAQESDDPAQRAAKKRMRARGEDVLKQLDKIRLGMLTGNLSVGNLVDIADVVASHRERINDPQLSSILDEIDLRAQIEIAKMRMALDAAKVF